MKKKSRLFIAMFSVLGLIVLILAGYLIKKKFVANKPESEEKKIKIGVILPLTGDLAFLGEDIKQGIDLAKDKNPNLEFLFQDAKSTAEAVDAANYLINVEKVNVIMSGPTFISYSIADITQRAKVLHISYSFDPTITNSRDLTIRILPSTEAYLEFDKYILKQGYTKISFLYPNSNEHVYSVEKLLSSELSAKGVDVQLNKYNPGETDFRSYLIKINHFKPQETFVVAYISDYPTLFKQATEMGLSKEKMTLDLNCLDLMYGPEFIDKKIVYGTKVVFPTSFLTSENNKRKEYDENYKKTHDGSQPSWLGYFSYDITNLLGQISVNNSPEQINNILKKTKNNGVSGAWNLDERGGLLLDYTMASVNNDGVIEKINY